jgi:hypothetical protein
MMVMKSNHHQNAISIVYLVVQLKGHLLHADFLQQRIHPLSGDEDTRVHVNI